MILICSVDRQPYPASLPTIRPDFSRIPSQAGVSHLSFDAEASSLLIRVEHQPNVLHIYTFFPAALGHLASLVFSHPIKSARWCPKSKRIAITTRANALFMWDGEGQWIEEGEEVQGGLMEGIGIPSSTYCLLIYVKADETDDCRDGSDRV